MTLEFSNFEVELSKKIQTSTSAYDILLYSKAIKYLKQSLVNVVSTVSALPDISSATEGSLYFVEADKIVYIADRTTFGGYWRELSSSVVTKIFVWGVNNTGKLGDGTTVSRSSPVSVVGGFTDWRQVSANSSTTLALRTNGTIWAWGSNSNGELGDGTTVSKSSPVSVVGGFTDWCQVSAGNLHTIAVRTNGTIWSWGANSSGQLGDNTTIIKSSPVSVVGGFTDWCQVSAGSVHTTAIRTNGTLWAWGCNLRGNLGDGTIVNRSSPVSVVGGFTDWCQVSAGGHHTLAVRTNGTAWAWGDNGSGQLGDNSTVSKSSPVSVIGGFTDWCQASAGGYHSTAVRTNGTLWVWGNNGQGRLGDNREDNKSSPVSVVGGFTNWCQVSAGESHSNAVRTDGTLWAWGNNNIGNLGDNTIVNKSSPISVIGGFTDWCQVSSAINHTAAIRKIAL